jgi:aminoglycoside phosphotransferase (APT) family kinase protein
VGYAPLPAATGEAGGLNKGDGAVPDDVQGPVVARGRDSVLIDLGGGRLLRRSRHPHTAETEIAVMDHVRAAGFPVPKVFEVRPPGDLVLERISGPTMLDDLFAHPWRFAAHARTLADLHGRLHQIEAPGGLRAPYGEATGARTVLLHQDLHPLNVLLSPRGPVVIDWTNACAGPGGADVADAWLLMAATSPDGGAAIRTFVRLFRGLFIPRFLHHAGRETAVPWLAQVAERRASDANLRMREKQAMSRLAHRHGETRMAPGKTEQAR